MLFSALLATACGGRPEVELPRVLLVAEGLAHVSRMSLDERRLVIADGQDLSQIDLDTLGWSRLIAHIDPDQILAADSRIYYRTRDRLDIERMYIDEFDPAESESLRLLTGSRQPPLSHDIWQLVAARAGELFVVAWDPESSGFELQGLRPGSAGVERRRVLTLPDGQAWAVMGDQWVWNPRAPDNAVNRYDLDTGESRSFVAPAVIVDMVAVGEALVVRTWDVTTQRWALIRLSDAGTTYLVKDGLVEDFPSGIMLLDCGIAGVTSSGLDFYPWHGAPSRPLTAKLTRWASAADRIHAYVSDGSFVYQVRVCDD